jgi:hypothetical protein
MAQRLRWKERGVWISVFLKETTRTLIPAWIDPCFPVEHQTKRKKLGQSMPVDSTAAKRHASNPLCLAEDQMGLAMLLWLCFLLPVFFLLIFGWRRVEYGFCVAALCLLQSMEEKIDAYSDKSTRGLHESKV